MREAGKSPHLPAGCCDSLGTARWAGRSALYSHLAFEPARLMPNVQFNAKRVSNCWACRFTSPFSDVRFADTSTRSLNLHLQFRRIPVRLPNITTPQQAAQRLRWRRHRALRTHRRVLTLSGNTRPTLLVTRHGPTQRRRQSSRACHRNRPPSPQPSFRPRQRRRRSAKHAVRQRCR